MSTQELNLLSVGNFFVSDPAQSPVPVAGFSPDSRMYVDLPAVDYQSDREALSCSMLKPLLISPAHFQEYLLKHHASTKAMDFGSLVHAILLQPHLVGTDFALYPGVADKRVAEYKAFEDANPTRMVVDEPTFSKARHLAEKILYRRVNGRYFGDFLREGKPEATIYVREPTTGLLLRVRIDLYHPEVTFDLKTTRHSQIRPFLRDGVDKDYDLQAFMYSLVRSLFEGTETPKPFVFVAAESEAPHTINVVPAGHSFLNNGAKKFQEALTVYAACSEAGYWPDGSGEAVAEIEPYQSFTPRMDWKAELTKIAAHNLTLN